MEERLRHDWKNLDESTIEMRVAAALNGVAPAIFGHVMHV